MKAFLPANEPERLEALRRYRILDTPPDAAFDHIAEVAACLFQVPIAMVSLVDHDRIWFKSHRGVETQQAEREAGLCASAIFSPEVYHVRDAIHDPRTLANPLVAGTLGCVSMLPLRCAPMTASISARSALSTGQPRELAPGRSGDADEVGGAGHGPDGTALAARKVAELEEVERRMSDQLRQANEALGQSEERFRDLFDEAPIAYVHEGVDTRLIRANRAAMRILGIKPEEVAGTLREISGARYS